MFRLQHSVLWFSVFWISPQSHKCIWSHFPISKIRCSRRLTKRTWLFLPERDQRAKAIIAANLSAQVTQPLWISALSPVVTRLEMMIEGFYGVLWTYGSSMGFYVHICCSWHRTDIEYIRHVQHQIPLASFPPPVPATYVPVLSQKIQTGIHN